MLTHFAMKFESSVISFGSKTAYGCIIDLKVFESSVISFGSKTRCYLCVLAD